ncbi:hypothetical protein ACSAXG_11940 (plasmid) [Staphylococcus chromogenes]
MNIEESKVLSPGNIISSKDIGIIKGTSPSSSMTYYLKNGEVKIKEINNPGDLVGKKVYTIGYPKNGNEANYQEKNKGTIKKFADGVFYTENLTSKGFSGGGLFLEETGELIGIVSGKGSDLSHFTPITNDVKNWIETNK